MFTSGPLCLRSCLTDRYLPFSEVLVIHFIPAAGRDEQFAHPVAVLQHFLLQLAAIAHQLARRFILQRRHVQHVHPVALDA